MNGVVDFYEGLDMTKVMFGQRAVQVPVWMVVQNQEEAVMFAGASKTFNLLYGTDKIHTLIVGNLIVRPQLVIATDAFKGYGIGGFWTGLPSAEDWLKNGEVIIAPGE